MTDKDITNTAELGNLSYMGLDNHITRVIEQISDGIKSSERVDPTCAFVDVTFNLVVEGQPVHFTVPVRAR
jgi:hypothetical protein